MKTLNSLIVFFLVYSDSQVVRRCLIPEDKSQDPSFAPVIIQMFSKCHYTEETNKM